MVHRGKPSMQLRIEKCHVSNHLASHSWRDGSLFGDFVWPALLLEVRLLTWYSVILGLAVEAVVLRCCLGFSWSQALKADLIMNAVSAAIGYIALPLAGLAWAFSIDRVLYEVFHWGSFHPIN